MPRRGDWSIVLTPTKPVPRDWFPPLGGAGRPLPGERRRPAGPDPRRRRGQGHRLRQQPQPARPGPPGRRSRGADDRDGPGGHDGPAAFPDARFDLIVHPCSNVFVPDVRPVWREAFRVLRPGGAPALRLHEPGALPVRLLRPGAGRVAGRPSHPLLRPGQPRPTRSGHGSPRRTIRSSSATRSSDQIGGQSPPGSLLTGFYEDIDPDTILGEYIPSYIATKATKPIP